MRQEFRPLWYFCHEPRRANGTIILRRQRWTHHGSPLARMHARRRELRSPAGKCPASGIGQEFLSQRSRIFAGWFDGRSPPISRSAAAAGGDCGGDQPHSGPNEMFLIEGHTDAVGANVDNLSLPDRRAESVAVVLTEVYRIPPENLVTQGYGEQNLKVPTDGPSALAARTAGPPRAGSHRYSIA
jgi:OmpA family